MSCISLCRSFLVNKLIIRMLSTNNNYENAVHKLNALQSNKATLEQIRRDIKQENYKCLNLVDMENYLRRTGVPLRKLDELSVIHVAGTKGKGSTSAMCESILRHHGFRTGLYTSPHLVAVRERIRLDGAVVTQDKFARHFHQVYDMLNSTQTYEGDMPKYFAFLTVLAFNMFLEEKVDVAIIEVGIGGVVDYTNILRKVPVVGITALGLDHTSILGNTIEEIADAKAGIMKPGCVAYTVEQPRNAMNVLRRVAAETMCPLTVVPNYKTYTFPNNCKSNNHLQVDIEAYQTNASLAIQLAHSWMRLAKLSLHRVKTFKKQAICGKIMRQNEILETDSYLTNSNKVGDEKINSMVPIETVTGLRECRWPGRYQVIRSDYATFYLDGAHTKESMEICAKWFEDNNRYQDKILIFSATGDRDVERLLKPLIFIDFIAVFFVIPKAYKTLNEKNDNYSIIEQKDLIARCRTNAEIWKEIRCNSKANLKVFECVSDALITIKSREYSFNKPSILISGSLHLVGAALSILDPSLSEVY